MEKNYCVYKHTTPDGKVYIGATRNRSSRFGVNGRGYSKQPFYAAIERYGWDNIAHEIVAEGLSKEEAEQIEGAEIARYNATDPQFGYNIRAYGIYCNDQGLTGAAYARICALNRSAEHISACAKAAHSRRGIPQKAETVKKIIDAKRDKGTLGRKCVCFETKEVFESYAEASRATGVSWSCIADACSGRAATAGGLHWCHEQDADTFTPQKGVRPVTRRVTNVETGEVFESGKEAAIKYNVTCASINYALKHPSARCKGFYWIYTDGEWRI